MKQLKIQSRKRYKQGFHLDAIELERIYSIIKEQMSKIELGDNEKIFNSFHIKYKNGVRKVTNELEEVVAEENFGTFLIERIEINSYISSKDEELADYRQIYMDDDEEGISIIFEKEIGKSFFNDNNISLIINGKERDWVMVTESLINDRINLIKRNKLEILTKPSLSFLFVIITFSLMISMFVTLYNYIAPSAYIDEIEQKWISGVITDPVEVIIKLEKEKYAKEFGVSVISYIPAIIGGSIAVLLLIIKVVVKKLYPVCVFYWGDYIKYFDKIDGIRKTIVTVIIIGFLISLAAGLIVKYI